MIVKFSLLSLALSLSCYGCADGTLHLKMELEDTYGLSTGDPVVFENDTVGTVASVESRDPNGFIANLEMSRRSAS